MNEEEFVLGENMQDCNEIQITNYEGDVVEFIEVNDIKEFIRRETNLINDFLEGLISSQEFREKRNKLIGDLEK